MSDTPNIPVPNFIDISRDAALAAVTEARAHELLTIPETAKMLKKGPTWWAPVTIERADRGVTKSGNMKVSIMIRFRPSPAGNEGRTHWINIYNKPKEGEVYSSQFLRNLTSLLYACGKFPNEGGLNGGYLSMCFPERGAVNVQSPLIGRSLQMEMTYEIPAEGSEYNKPSLWFQQGRVDNS